MDARRLTSASDPTTILKKIEKTGWLSLVTLSIGTLIFASPAHAAAAMAGGILGLGNFRGMDLYFSRIFRQEGPRLRWWHHALYALRFLALLAAIGGVIAWGRLPIVAVVIGLSVPFMGIVFYAAFALIKGEAAAKA